MPSGVFYSVLGSKLGISLLCVCLCVCLFLGRSSAPRPGDTPWRPNWRSTLAIHPATHLATHVATHLANHSYRPLAGVRYDLFLTFGECSAFPFRYHLSSPLPLSRLILYYAMLTYSFMGHSITPSSQTQNPSSSEEAVAHIIYINIYMYIYVYI